MTLAITHKYRTNFLAAATIANLFFKQETTNKFDKIFLKSFFLFFELFDHASGLPFFVAVLVLRQKIFVLQLSNTTECHKKLY